MADESAIYKAGVEVARDLVKDILAKGVELTKKEAEKLTIDFNFAFSRFLDRNEKRLSKVKTILNPAKPVLIEDFFEAPNFQIDKIEIDDEEFLSQMMALRYIVITGMGGSGKSIFLKHLFLLFKKERLQKIPFFIELKNVKSKTLSDYLADQLLNIRSSITKVGFEHALGTGRFLFLLDGLDEVETVFRKDLVTQLHELVYAYDDNIFIVSSRPDLNLSAWSEFYEAKIRGFSKDQAISLIKRVDYDHQLKERFIASVDKHLYQSHSAYMSNPLLCLILLMTYEGGAGIPERLHVFFAQAFDVLFYRHDATKGDGYRRKFESDLDIDDFRNVFSGFGMFSYMGAGSAISNEEAKLYADKSLSFFDKSCKAADFLHDLNKSLSLVIKDADKYYYIHRTFQEYFVALFLAKQMFPGWDKVVHEIATTKVNDTVIAMLMEMDRHKFDLEFFKTPLLRLQRKLKENIHSVIASFQIFYVSVDLQDDHCPAITIASNEEFAILQILEKDETCALHEYIPHEGNWRELFLAAQDRLPRDEQDRENESASITVLLSDHDEDLVRRTPIKTYVEAIRESVDQRLREIDQRESNKKGLVAANVLDKLRSVKAEKVK